MFYVYFTLRRNEARFLDTILCRLELPIGRKGFFQRGVINIAL